MAKITVIIPTYNRAHCIERALLSVLQQTLAVNEIIVVDDGSTDETAKVLKLYHDQIRYIKQANAGVSQARNTAIKQAKTPWLAFLDSDDAWHPQKLEKQCATLTNQLICHTDERWYRNGRRVNPKKIHKKRGGWIFEHCLPRCAISPSSALMHRDLFKKVGLFDETLPACEDYDLWLRISANHEVAYVDEPLTIKYGGHEDQLSKKYWGMDRFRIKALQKIITSNTLNPTQLEAAKTLLTQKIAIYLQGANKRNKQTAVLLKELGRESHEKLPDTPQG